MSSEVAVKLLASPVTLADRFWGEKSLYEWQKAVLLAAWPFGSRVAMVTPNEAGKTSCVVASLGLSYMAAYPGSQVVSTAGVFRQISQQLWPVLRGKLSRYPAWSITEDKITAPGVRGLPGSTWTAFSAADEGKAEGYHSRRFMDDGGREVYCPLLYIIDEAKTVKQGIFNAMYRCDPDNVLVCSTPGDQEGPFWEIIYRKPEGWEVFEVTWEDCPHLMVGRKGRTRRRMIEELGETNPFVQSFVFGKFSRSGDYFLFDEMAAVDEAMDGGTIEWVRFEKRAAIDLSGGVEPTVLAWRDGNKVMPMDEYRDRDAALLARKLVERLKQIGVKPSEVVADAGGQGDPIIDMMEDMGFSGIRRYYFNAPATDRAKYADKSAEDHFWMRGCIMRGEVILPKDIHLREQMMKRRFTRRQDGDGALDMGPKRDVLNGEKIQSPDKLDALSMLLADFQMPQTRVRKKREYRRCEDFSVESMTNDALADYAVSLGMNVER